MTNEQPLLLALDTATRVASVAVCRGAVPLAQQSREVTTHSEGLLPMIDDLLGQAGVAVGDLSAVVCGRGPGSFTGLRIGMSTAKGLCLAAGRPLVCVSSLWPLGLAAREQGAAGHVLALIDARRGEVYCALYRDGEPVGEESVCGPEEAAAMAPAGKVTLVGDGALAHEATLRQALGPRATLASAGCHSVAARHLVPEGLRRLVAGETDDLAAAVPRYIRKSDARLPAVVQDRREEAVATHEPERAWLEQLRDSGLRLDREGRWWHEGTLVEHGRLAAALHRWLDMTEEGRYVVRMGGGRQAHVEVEDAPYVVRTARLETGPGDEAARVWLGLSDGNDEELDAATVVVGEDDALYCRVKQGRFEARFARQAQHTVAELVEQDASGFLVRLGGRCFPIHRRGGA